MQDRRDKCNVPDDVTFHTKPQLAVEMLQAIRSEGRLPFKYLVADCLYGNSPDFLDAIDACIGVTSLVSVPADTRCWLQRPPTTEKTYTYKGEVRAKRVVASADAGPSHGGEPWRRVLRPRAGIAVRSPKAPKARSPMSLPANG